jgi:hypothetical protein
MKVADGQAPSTVGPSLSCPSTLKSTVRALLEPRPRAFVSGRCLRSNGGPQVVVSGGGSTKDPDAKGAPAVAKAAEGPSRSGDVGGVPTGSVANRQDSAELAKELVIDLRSELTRIDARAAAGVALSAAVLLGLVGQTSIAAPIYWWPLLLPYCSPWLCSCSL